MPSLLQTLALTLALLHDVVAVTITLYVGGTKDCNGNVAYTCNDFPEGEDECCSNGGRYGSALFTGLPTEGVPAQGVVYYYVQLDTSLENCGSSCNAGTNLDGPLCLSCTENNPTGPYIDGANWYFPAAEKGKRDNKKRECKPRKPDMLTLRDGRSFHINRDVPEGITKELMFLGELSASGEEVEVREELLKYEVV